jgi:hypothetical protein
MNRAQIIEARPLQVYVPRGELVIHFSTPADLINRLAETSAVLSELDRQTDGSTALFTDPVEGSPVPRYLSQPELVLGPFGHCLIAPCKLAGIWRTPRLSHRVEAGTGFARS